MPEGGLRGERSVTLPSSSLNRDTDTMDHIITLLTIQISVCEGEEYTKICNVFHCNSFI